MRRAALWAHAAGGTTITSNDSLNRVIFAMSKIRLRLFRSDLVDADYEQSREAAKVVVTPKSPAKAEALRRAHRQGIGNKSESTATFEKQDADEDLVKSEAPEGKARKGRTGKQPRSNRGRKREADLVRLEPRRSRKAETHRRKSEPQGS
ncbi:hypothetical protein, partial [Streptomyces niger]|uniref:hypothetical protein n=1 Tax=Streptomyces niger TaxID=66373 RepID=UPI001F274973